LVISAIHSVGKSPATEYATDFASVLLIAPTLALLGAKRPQNGAWQFIVVTLVVVLNVPVVRAWAFDERSPEIPLLFQWLIVAHIAIGIVNYLPTRFIGPAILYGAAQSCLAQLLLDRHWWTRSVGTTLSAFFFCMALIWLKFETTRPRKLPRGLTLLWIDFRDAYGLVWGLRVAERLNAAATQHGWPVEFTWGGIIVKTESGELPADVQHRVERELRSMLRRFVSHDWIARRLESSR